MGYGPLSRASTHPTGYGLFLLNRLESADRRWRRSGQVMQPRQSRWRIPIGAAIYARHELAGRVDDEGDGNAWRVQRVGCRAVRVQQDRQIGNPVAFVEWFHGFHPLEIDGNGQDQNFAPAELRGDGGEAGEFGHTGAAPGCPDVHH